MTAETSQHSVWHSGELAVRRRAAAEELSEAGIRSSIPEGLARFLAVQRVAAFGSVDGEAKLWASLRLGQPGFIRAVDSATVQTVPLAVDGDPLLENLRARPGIGMVIIDFATRRRVRINGEAEVLADGGLRIHTRQVYGNCPQYIQIRVTEDSPGRVSPTAFISRTMELSSDQQRRIGLADTFFIATAHPESGVDASHRGGNPGFIKVESSRRLRIPDYSGNHMFNTLGNISVNPAVGLVFPDFEHGRTLQLSGRATIDWQPDREQLPGAERALVFETEDVIEIEQPALRTYEFKSYSPFNPKLPGDGR